MTASILYDPDRLLHHKRMPKVRTRSISKTFPDGTKALCGVDLEVNDSQIDVARAKKPIAERTGIGARVFTFEDVPRQELEGLGRLSTPRVADLFVAKMS